MSISRASLQIVLFADLSDGDVKSFVDALDAAISSGRSAGGYVPSMDDLGIQFTRFTANEIPSTSTEELLKGFQHTVFVVLVTTKWVATCSAQFWNWMGKCLEGIQQDNSADRAVSLLLDERAGRSFAEKIPTLGARQMMEAYRLGELAIRPAMFALLILHECRLALASRLPCDPGVPRGNLRLFISHAKLDGLPLAQALKHQIKQIPWLESFYDADDLASGSDWKKELEAAAKSSIIVILRSEYYDTRYWCQQEVLWSEEYATPTILVELRTGMNYSAGMLPFDRAPTVRVTDGNLFRIVFLAVRESLRFLCFIARVEEMKRAGELPGGVNLRVFCTAPAMPALLRACEELKACHGANRSRGLILYPDPPLRAGVREAAIALVEQYASDIQLVTPLTLATNAPFLVR